MLTDRLYGDICFADNAGQHEHVNLNSAGFSERTAAGRKCRPGCQDIINQKNPAARHQAGPAAPDTKRARNIPAPGPGREACLAGSPPQAHERVHGNGGA
jgi:hypothetical protein